MYVRKSNVMLSLFLVAIGTYMVVGAEGRGRVLCFCAWGPSFIHSTFRKSLCSTLSALEQLDSLSKGPLDNK